METLKEKHRPQSLREILGQPAVQDLRILACAPRPCCILLTGPTGTGKSTATEAFARDMGCYDGAFETVYTVCGADLDADAVRHWFGTESPFRFKAPGKGYHVLILEELETVNKTVAILLKDCLERRLKNFGNVIVIATSNDTTDIPRAVLDRFKRFNFDGGLPLASAVQSWLKSLWTTEAGQAPIPQDFASWGWDYETEEFSARRAVDALEEAIRDIQISKLRAMGAL